GARGAVSNAAGSEAPRVPPPGRPKGLLPHPKPQNPKTQPQNPQKPKTLSPLSPGLHRAPTLEAPLPIPGTVNISLPAQDTSGILNELRTRSETVFEANARFVDEHNRRVRNAATSATSAASGSARADGVASALAEGTSYSLSLNHFAHLTHEQWAAGMLGLKRSSTGGGGSSSAADAAATGGGRTQLGSAALGTYERVLTDDQLPANVDWRGTGADGPGVKDQACCGSCWAFAATGAMQAAWFKVTGQSVSFSEQQFLDCSWNFGNTGCGGGDVVPALKYLLQVGGVAAQEADYPYIGQNGFCRVPFIPSDRPDSASNTNSASNTTSASASSSSLSKAPPVARFSGFQRTPSRDEKALMEAVALHGPVAVGIDGGQATFRFYSEGIYHDPHCGQKLDALDHAVLLVGYGTTPEGVDYWLIKNSWSKYWGMDGYARITRKGNDCGVSTDAVLALASKVPPPGDGVEEEAEDDDREATATTTSTQQAF
ncbi:hypothetical protein Vafri_10565, partial [Volvox africanus]